jgi:hypothetical protein
MRRQPRTARGGHFREMIECCPRIHSGDQECRPNAMLSPNSFGGSGMPAECYVAPEFIRGIRNAGRMLCCPRIHSGDQECRPNAMLPPNSFGGSGISRMNWALAQILKTTNAQKPLIFILKRFLFMMLLLISYIGFNLRHRGFTYRNCKITLLPDEFANH